jgi:hypothetical protein
MDRVSKKEVTVIGSLKLLLEERNLDGMQQTQETLRAHLRLFGLSPNPF